jgi:hypothetical protein
VTAVTTRLSLADLHPDVLVSVQDVARFLGCSPRTATRAGIPHVYITLRVRRYRVRDVLAWIEAHVRDIA